MDLDRMEERLAAIFTEYSTPGAAVGILHRGEVTELVYGIKDVRTAEPVAADTVFQCGSLTKTWTALAFMQLVDEGMVHLDEPVRTYLPRFRVADPDASARVTPRHLLNHTNGIEEAYGDPGEGADVYERMVAQIADAPQVSPVGHTHGYSAALGYAILARIMEVLDGKPWDAIMRERLFGPMGLTATNSWHGDVDATRTASGHLIRSEEEGPIPTPIEYLPRSYGPGGNVTATVGEVLALANVLLSGGVALNGVRIVSDAAVREMMTSRVPVPDPYMFGPHWALGLVVCDWFGTTVYAHDGSTIGQNARMRILPDDDLALVLLTNGGQREAIYKDVFNAILAELGTVTIPPLPEQDRGLALDPSRYVGVYERPGTAFEVTAEGARLHLTVALDPMQAEFMGLPDHITYELLPISETHFLMPPVGPLEDVQTVAIYDFRDGAAQYLHTNSRVHRRTSEGDRIRD
ncbi:beta-lactamase family protein [Agromyces sp. SYSU K20354]|uniref:serine hydrolase domain-containing protein n=1 Tax=Agromyces cavernae TaxID=2898659 RepID=UPI001E336A68|nr:serine hydrolase domain-containing protein [Agromyces cavernae]MCD2442131.1 beta-lactamase family protein [Agromyces cavernae]